MIWFLGRYRDVSAQWHINSLYAGKRVKKEAKCEKIFYGLDNIMTHGRVQRQPAHLNEHSSDTGHPELPHLPQVYAEHNEGGEVKTIADTGDIQNSLQSLLSNLWHNPKSNETNYNLTAVLR